VDTAYDSKSSPSCSSLFANAFFSSPTCAFLTFCTTPFDHALHALPDFHTLILPINPANLITLKELLSIFHTSMLPILHNRILREGSSHWKTPNTEGSRSLLGLQYENFRELPGSIPQLCQATFPHTDSTSLATTHRALAHLRAMRILLLDSLLLMRRAVAGLVLIRARCRSCGR
jgi:hypothetical protein